MTRKRPPIYLSLRPEAIARLAALAERTVEVTCMFCGEQMPVLDNKHVMPHHDGCAGYPYCSCKVPHKGNCPHETEE